MDESEVEACGSIINAGSYDRIVEEMYAHYLEFIDELEERGLVSTASSSTEPPEPEKPDCVVCLERKATWIFSGCGHLCLCKPCSRKANLKKSAATCPICRQESKMRPLTQHKGDVFFP